MKAALRDAVEAERHDREARPQEKAYWQYAKYPQVLIVVVPQEDVSASPSKAARAGPPC